jgi:hypothetical protein
MSLTKKSTNIYPYHVILLAKNYASAWYQNQSSCAFVGILVTACAELVIFINAHACSKAGGYLESLDSLMSASLFMRHDNLRILFTWKTGASVGRTAR